MVVIRQTKGGSYILGELDGALLKLRFAAFHLIPYSPRDIKAIPVTRISDEQVDEMHKTSNRLDLDASKEE